MRKIYLIVIILVVFVLESRISVFGVQPNFSAALAYYFGLRYGENKGLFWGAFIGIIGDSLAENMIGPNLLGKATVGFLAAFISGSVFRWTPLSGMIYIFLLSILDGIIVFSSLAIFSNTPTSVSNAAFTILISSVLNSFLGIFLRPKDE